MKKSKIFVMIALCFMAMGLVVGGLGFILGGRPGFYINASGIHAANSNDPDSVRILEKTELNAFTKLDIQVSFADIRIIPADSYYLEYRLMDHGKEPAYGVKDNTLKLTEFEEKGTNSFFNFFTSSGVNFFSINSSDSFYVNLYVPQDVYFEWVHLSNNSGNMKLDNISAKELVLDLSFGNLDMENFEGDTFEATLSSGNVTAGAINCQSVNIVNSFGNISIDKIKADTADITLSSGNLYTENMDAKTLTVQNSFGEVTFDTLINSSGEISLSSGNFEAGNAVLGFIDIDNSFGDVDIRLKDSPDQYSLNLGTDFGDVRLKDGSKKGRENVGSSYVADRNDDNEINVYCSSGDITISQED